MSIDNILHSDILLYIKSLLNEYDLKIIDDDLTCVSNVCSYYSACGYLSILKWIYSQIRTFNTQIASVAAANGHLEVVKWFVSLNYYINSNAIIYAERNGYIELGKWVRVNQYT